jgi:tRNA(Ile)-lysidine synthase
VTVASQPLLEASTFPAAGSSVDLAVSGGPDSVGLLLLAMAAGLTVSVHHVDHHARATSGADAQLVRELCARLEVPCAVHDVIVEPGGNFEARARAQRRGALPEGALTGHTMDDLAETVLLNMVRGAGVDGLTPMVRDPTKPLVGVRRSHLHDFVAAAGVEVVHDETNEDDTFQRNRVRHHLIPMLNDLAQRDVVPILARQADVLYEDRAWLEELVASDLGVGLSELDCRELRQWPRARLRRWLRAKLAVVDELGERHPPSSAEVERALEVVDGAVVAAELSGGRRLARSLQRLSLEDRSTTLIQHG